VRPVAVDVLPHTVFDRLLLSGFSAEVWMPPGVSADTVRARAGLNAREPTRSGGVGVVLGAGNITAIAPLDVLSELFAHNRVVALKLNPIMDAMLSVYQNIFAPLIDLGVLAIVTGATDVGGYLVRHDLVDHVHITGGAASHDAIVWGRGDEAVRRRARHDPQLTKPITSELGGVSPIIVLPGTWSKADLKFQAEHVATMRLHNGGYNCIAGQVVVLSAGWPQQDDFLAELRDAMLRAPSRVAYYPGTDRRVADACAAHPTAQSIGGRRLVTGETDRTYLLQTEFFARCSASSSCRPPTS
jgi:aldehyde dehydrogenase (NAD(P)+)